MSEPPYSASDPARPLRRRWSRYTSTFVDVPPGPDWRDRLRAALGAVGGIAVTGLLCGILLGSGLSQPMLVAPMGASAVLLFAVPSSPLAQPWSIVGGNIVSALIGISLMRLVPEPVVAAALAVGVAIAVMSLLRCLHPPGGAVALAAAMGLGGGHYAFALVPVGINCLLLVVAGWLFHRISGHSYPHRAPVPLPVHATRDAPPLERAGLDEGDVQAAMAAYGEPLDVNAGDLTWLFKEAELHAAARSHGALTVGAVMSCDLVTIAADATAAEVRALLAGRALLCLPVVDGDGHVEGVITPLGALRIGAHARDLAEPPFLATSDAPLASLLRPLSDGRRHEIVVVDEEGRLTGLVTQSDLIGVLAATS